MAGTLLAIVELGDAKRADYHFSLRIFRFKKFIFIFLINALFYLTLKLKKIILKIL